MWVLIPVLSALVGFEMGDWIFKGRFPTPLFWLIWFAFSLPGMLLEFNAGYARVALTLPFTSRQMARIFWLLSVGIPTSLLVVFGGLGLFVNGRVNSVPTQSVLPLWAEMVPLAGLVFGSFFWITSGSPLPVTDPGQRKKQQVWLVGFLLAVAAFGWWLYQATYSREIKCAIFAVPALLFTIFGWYRAEGLLVEYGGWQRDNAVSEPVVGPVKSPVGKGGLAYLLGRFALVQVGSVLSIAAAVAGWIAWEKSRGNDDVALIWAWFMPPFVCLMISINQMSSLVGQLRCLRMLPLTGTQVAGLLLGVTLAPFLSVGLLMAVLVGTSGAMAAGVAVGKAVVLALAPVCLLVVGGVSNNEGRWGRSVLLAIGICLTGALPFYQMVRLAVGGTGLPTAFAVGYAVAFLAAAYYSLGWLLERSDMTYRRRVVAGSGAWNGR
jgi:hypothetical protein